MISRPITRAAANAPLSTNARHHSVEVCLAEAEVASLDPIEMTASDVVVLTDLP
jgi:hypothetical protein